MGLIKSCFNLTLSAIQNSTSPGPGDDRGGASQVLPGLLPPNPSELLITKNSTFRILTRHYIYIHTHSARYFMRMTCGWFRCPRRLATLVKFDYKAESLWSTQTCNSLGSSLLQVVLVKLVKLHVQYGKLSMDCASWRKTCLRDVIKMMYTFSSAFSAFST